MKVPEKLFCQTELCRYQAASMIKVFCFSDPWPRLLGSSRHWYAGILRLPGRLLQSHWDDGAARISRPCPVEGSLAPQGRQRREARRGVTERDGSREVPQEERKRLAWLVPVRLILEEQQVGLDMCFAWGGTPRRLKSGALQRQVLKSLKIVPRHHFKRVRAPGSNSLKSVKSLKKRPFSAS